MKKEPFYRTTAGQKKLSGKGKKGLVPIAPRLGKRNFLARREGSGVLGVWDWGTFC